MLGLMMPELARWTKALLTTNAPVRNDLVSWINVTLYAPLEFQSTLWLLWIMFPLRDALLAALTVALILGFPLGLGLAGRPRLAEPARLVLDTLQTLPALV